uniref:Glycolipid transfer protein domain-containing protein n=1 Tax=Oncorhynchus tshawytscha TaxID=74940 RepID=A0A8C8GG99_ONCTS
STPCYEENCAKLSRCSVVVLVLFTQSMSQLSQDCLGSIVFARVKSDIAGTTLALMWLKRSDKWVRFIQVLLQTCALALKKYHGWLVQKLFKVTVFAAPYKADFLRALSKRSRKRTAGTKYDFLVNFTATDAIYEKYTKMNAEI